MSAPAWFVRNVATDPITGHTTHEGVVLRWYRWGPAEGPPVVLVHGAAANHAWWSPIAPLLAGFGPVVAVELSGMGDSGWRDDGYRIEQWADEVYAALAAACPDAAMSSDAVLVGHSLGASVASAVAVRQPHRWTRVVLCDLGLGSSRSRRAEPAAPSSITEPTDRTSSAATARAARAARAGRHFTNRILYDSEAEALAHFSLVPRQGCANPWMMEHVARHSIRPVGPGGVGDPARPPAGEEIGWSWKFDWRLFARTSERPLVDYLGELGRMTHSVHVRPRVVCLNGSLSRVATVAVAARISELTIPDRTVWITDAAHHLMLDQPLAFVAALRDSGVRPSGR